MSEMDFQILMTGVLALIPVLAYLWFVTKTFPGWDRVQCSKCDWSGRSWQTKNHPYRSWEATVCPRCRAEVRARYPRR